MYYFYYYQETGPVVPSPVVPDINNTEGKSILLKCTRTYTK